MHKLTRIGLIGTLITIPVVLVLNQFSVPMIGTSPLFLVWGTCILIGISRKTKKD